MSRPSNSSVRSPSSKTTTVRKPYSKALGRALCDKVEEGYSVAEICRDNQDYFPDETTIYRWKKRHPEFKEELDQAYQIFFYKKIDEIEILSKELLDVEKSTRELDALESPAEKKNWMLARRAHQDAIRLRLDTLKFVLAKIAPKIVNDLRDVPASHTMSLPSITIVNYSDTPKDKKETKLLT